MKAEINEKDVVKHWGIWFKEQESWLVGEAGLIFSVTCPRVANVQYDLVLINSGPEDGKTFCEENMEVREIK